MTTNVGQARPPPARMRAGYVSFMSTGREKKSQQEVVMKHHVKGLVAVAGLFLVLVIPAHGQVVTTNYPNAPFAVNFAAGTPNAAGVYRQTQAYMFGGTNWVTTLSPVTPISIPGGGGTTLPGAPNTDFNLLSTAFPGSSMWTYQSGVLAPGSLTVTSYAAVGTPATVGADFYVTYTPKNTPTITDPTTNVHWIQIIYDNYNITNNVGYGNKEFIVDNGASPRGDEIAGIILINPNGRTPYYDDGGAAITNTNGYTGYAFYDLPSRDNPGQKDTWVADLYLVSGPAPGTGPGNIIIYGGVQWGWNNTPVPLPSALLLFAPALAGIGVFRRRFKK